MEMLKYTKLYSKRYQDVFLKVVPGHFVTPNAHINYYIDMTTMKARQNEAANAAQALSEAYASTTVVDTILCLDGTQVIGAYLANELTRAGIMSRNAHQTIYITTPEYDLSGQMIFRDSTQIMVRDKNVLLLMASITTGKTAARAIDSVRYYGGRITGISSIFSVVSKICGMPVNALFTKSDLPEYKSYPADACAMCQEGRKVDAIANGFGYSQV
ncbi:MAG: phosphoribosyltransferase [Lachnospiraceae bacterium]|nr:phosphoribosyltransferase [Lachnospiraceae bacterium]